jgi:probable rRNA maturation factor
MRRLKRGAMTMIEGGLAPDIQIDILVEAGDWLRSVPAASDLAHRAAKAAITGENMTAGALELSILLTDDAAIAELNSQWRGKSGPTNVLSFPAEMDAARPPPAGAPVLLGDIAVALETLMTEARDAGIGPKDHLRHLVVHGVLHLCGYDHENDADAERMEGREIEILKALGVSDPYAATEQRLENARP